MAASKFRIASSSFTSDATFSGSVIFNQDVTVSGTLNVYEMKTTLVSSSIIFKSGSTKFGDTSDDLHQFTGSAEFSSGLSGSLTKLVDGTSYLVAGTNITITTASNGQITIDSSGGGGTPGGSSGQVQFNDGGSFAGDASFTFNSTTNSLTVTNLSGSLTELSDRSPYLISSGSIKLSTGSSGQVTIGMNITDLTTDSNNGSLNDEIMIADDSDAGRPKKLSLSKVQDLVNTNTTYTAGTGLTLSSTEFNLDFSELTDMTGDIAGTTEFILQDGTAESRKAASEIKLSAFNNDAGFTTNTGDIEGVTAGTGLSGGGSTGTVTLDIDDSVVATLSGSQFSGNVGITGSLGVTSTLDVGGTLSVAEYISCTTDSNTFIRFNGADTIQFRAGGITMTQITESTQDVYIHNPDRNDVDLQINTSNANGTIFVDSADDSVIIGHEGFDVTPAASEVSGYGTDVKVYISGSIGAKDTSTRGVTLIAGDSIVSGTLYAPTAISGSLTRLTDGTSYLIAGTDITITSASNGSITINSDAASVSSLDDLSDVDLTVSPSDTSILVYDSTASAFERQILSGDATMTREGVVTVISASSAGKIDTTATNPIATYYIPFVENSTATEGDIVHVSSNITVDQAGSFSAVGVTATGNVNAGAALVHDGDSDTRIAFTTDRIKIEAGGVEFFDFLESTSGQDSATFNLDGVDIDFRMLSNNLEAAIHLDAGNDQLVLMGNQDSHVKYFAATGIPGDVNLFMSGTAGSKGTATKGTALFGGDVVISGSLYDAGGNEIVSLGGSALTASLGIESRGDVYVAGNADSTLILESPLMATSRLYGKLAAADPRVNDANTYIDFTDDEIEFYAGSARMLTLREGASDQIIFNEASADINFRVETNNLQAAIYSDGGTDQLAFGANVTDISALSLGTDVNILLSGTIGSKGTSTKGTVVASGDMVVSGTFHNPGIVHVFAQAGGVTNITADTYQPIAFSAETTDTHNSFASSQFTAPYDGYYLINTMVMLNSIDTAADGYRLFVTGSSDVLPRAVMLASFDPDELFPGGDTGAAGVTESNSINGSTTVYMPENSTLQVFIYQAGGTSQTTANRIIGSLGVDGTHVTITKIG